MSEQITTILKRKLEDLTVYGGLPAETRRNALKEELQYYVLNFLYHDPEYGSWIMYGGLALRISHGLDRMSVDLDFEVPHAITEKFLEESKKEIEEHFLDTYGTDPDLMSAKITTGRGLLLKFNVGEELSFGHPSKQVHVKIDLSHLKDPGALFDKLTLQMHKVSDKNLEQDLKPLFTNKTFVGNWLKNWRESYFSLLRDYRIRTVTSLTKIMVKKDFGSTDNYYYTFWYATKEKEGIKVEYIVSYEWFKYDRAFGNKKY